MPSVGTAYVNIRVSTKGFEAGLDKMLARMSTKMEAQGTKLGKDFERGLNKSDPFKPLVDKSNKATTALLSNNQKISDSSDRAMLNIADGSNVAGDGLRDLQSEAKKTQSAVGDLGRSASGTRRSLGGLGGSDGGGLRKAANDAGWFESKLNGLSGQGVGVRQMLAGIHDSLAFFGTAASVAVGGLSSAAQGIFAIGANAASAAPAIAILANGMMSLAQVGGVIAIAMKGVGGAISAGFKSVNAATKGVAAGAATSAKAIQAAARGVRDAKQALQDAYAAAARSAEDAARRTSEAEANLADAATKTAEAHKALRDAVADARDEIKQIGFDAEEASLKEDRAALSLADAQQALIATSELAPDDRARVEAELSYKEAELNMREAKKAREDADKEQKKVAGNNIEGTNAMKDAHKNLADAQNTQIGAQKDLNDARREEAQTAEDNAKRIAKAQQGVADAQQALADAQKQSTKQTTAATTAADAYKTALAKLGPEQRRFVERIVAMRGEFQKFSNAVEEPLFAHLNTALDNFNKKGKDGQSIMDVLTKRLQGTSRELGFTAENAATLASNDIFQKHLSDAMGYNNIAIGNFGDSVVNLADAFVSVADAAGPLFVDFSAWIKSVTGNWAQNASNNIGGMRKTIETAGDRVKEFFGLIKELWRWLRLVGGSANTAANRFGDVNRAGKDIADKGYISSITDSLRHFNDEMAKPGEGPKRIERFSTALENMNAAGRAIKNAIIDPLITMGSDKRVGETFDKIAQSDAFDRLAASASEAGPALGDLVVNLADIFATLSESGSMTTFITDVGKVAAVLADIVDKVPPSVLRAIGVALGTIAAVRFVSGIGQKALAFLTPPGLNKIPGKMRGIAGKVITAGGEIEAAGKEVTAGFELSLGTGMGQAIEQAGVLAKSLGKSVVTGVKSTLNQSQGVQVGKEAITGIAMGIEAATSGAVEAGVAAANRIMLEIKLAMGVHSPSTITTAAAKDVMAGVTLGLEEGTASAVTAANAAGTEVGAAVGTSMGAAATVASTELETSMGAAAATVSADMAVVDGALAGTQVAMETTGAVAEVSSIGVRAFGTAMEVVGGPIGLLMLIVPLLIPVFMKLNEKFHLMDKAMTVLKWTLDKLVDGFQWLWDKIKDLFGWIKNNWPLVVGILTGPIGLAVALIIKHWNTVLAFVKAVPGKIKNFLKGVWNVLSDGLRTVWARVLAIWNRITTWVKGRPAQFVRNMKALWNIFSDGLRTVWAKVQEIWGRITTWVKGRPDQFMRNLKALWSIFSSGLSTAWENVKSKWETIKGKIAEWPGQIKDSLSGMWDGLKSGFAHAVNWVGNRFQKYLFDPLNSVLDTFGVDKITITYKPLELASGGPVRGPGGPKDDRVPARLSNGEHVLTAAEVRAMGGHRGVQAMRKAALHGGAPVTGGIPGWGWVKDKADDVKGAIARGAQFAAKWVIERFTNGLGTGLLPSIVTQILTYGAGKISGWGKKKDAQALSDTGGGPVSPGGWTRPIIGYAPSTGAGRYYLSGGYGSHSGWDFPSPLDTPIRAASTGRVVSIIPGWTSYGHYVKLMHSGGVETIYGHMHKFASGLKTGMTVKPGTIIGYVDSTGHSTGNHLHFEVRTPTSPYLYGSVDPLAFLRARGVRLGSGGVVSPSSQGTLAVLAEAGRHERVTPLDSEGFTPAERRILESLETSLGGGGSGDTYHVHPSPGMNETALADMVARRMAWKRRRGTGRR